MALLLLPHEILEQILSCVAVDDLGRLCCVCKYLRDAIIQSNKLWKCHCQAVWLRDKLDKSIHSNWHSQWMGMVKEFGPYRWCYADVRHAWDLIEEFIACKVGGSLSHCLQSGISEEKIAAVEAQLDFSFPSDYRCSLRIHDGYSPHSPIRFLGGLQFYSFNSDLVLFPLDTLLQFHQSSLDNPWRMNKQYFKIASGLSRIDYTFLLALEECQFSPPGHVVKATVMDWAAPVQDFPHNGVIPGHSVGLLGEPKLFKDWLMEEAKALPSYPILKDNSILRFHLNPEWEATTGYFTVRVGTALDPSLGRWDPYNMMSYPAVIRRIKHGGCYAYWISIKMHDDAPEEESCQLMTRHWVIKYDGGREERVDGPGVVGEFPKFSPGSVHQYASYNFFTEHHTTMEGHFTMYYQRKSGSFPIRIPKFYMELPDLTWI